MFLFFLLLSFILTTILVCLNHLFCFVDRRQLRETWWLIHIHLLRLLIHIHLLRKLTHVLFIWMVMHFFYYWSLSPLFYYSWLFHQIWMFYLFIHPLLVLDNWLIDPRLFLFNYYTFCSSVQSTTRFST
jgi:hypothetical protein